MKSPLPIDASLASIRSRLAETRALVIVAPPGAGKTTRVPPALAADGPVLVLQPRRVAARAIARRIATEQGWTLGREVGWQVRFARRFSVDTRVLLATEGILTARLADDPLASDFTTIVLDEFHERSIHADLGLALARQAWYARDTLRLVVMSATLEAAPVAAFLGGCPVVEVTGRPHPLELSYAPGVTLADAVAEMAGQTSRSVLCFLPGAPEIRRALPEIARRLPAFDVVALHGSLDADEQDRALAAGDCRRIILSTNIAETSLTVPDVDGVVDTGLQKVARYDAARGIDSLATERVSLASADQRAGRAARVGPGRALRLWDPRDRLRVGREPDIARIDLAATLLDLAAWGADSATFEWFEAPPAGAVDRAWQLLARLGAVEGRALTALGRRMQAFPLHPRLARTLIAAGGAFEACAACALLSERTFLPARREATSCDLLPAIDDWAGAPGHVRQIARQIEDTAAAVLGGDKRARIDEDGLRRALHAGYPDRLARRRDQQGPRLILASGTGATLSPESGLVDGDFLVALEVHSHGPSASVDAIRTARDARAPAAPAAGAVVRIASRVDRPWIVATGVEIEHVFDPASGRVRATRRERVDTVVLTEHHVAPDPGRSASLLAEAWLDRGPREGDVRLVRRLTFAGLDVNLAQLVRAASVGARTLDEIEPAAHLTPDQRRMLDREAPELLTVPSGRRVRIEYLDDGTVSVAARLQELFGLAETPRVGSRRAAVLLHLLAPNGRPVQTTRDLQSFWARTYPEVRKELRGRYPRHAWPDDPRTAPPIAKPRPRER